MKILIKFPSRGRKEQFKSVLKKYVEKSSGKHEIKFVFSFDIDDLQMHNQDVIDHINNLGIENEIFYGNNTNKIQAINANMSNQNFEILILASDDMVPILQNYDDEIVKKFEESNLGLDGVIHIDTPRWSNLLDVNCILGYEYYKRFDYIYHPTYKSIFADNEYTEVSKMLNKNYFTPRFHPFLHDWKGGDETEIRNFKFNNEDSLNYEHRKSKNFDLSI